jgi:hypothetical protein
MLVARLGPPAQSRARATYMSDVSKLNAFASFSLFLPLLSSLSTTASAFFIFAPPQRCFKRSPPENSSLTRTRRCQRCSTRLAPLPLLLLVVRLRLRASVFSALRPARDRHTPTARRVRGVRGALAPRARPPPRGPARLSAGQARRVRSQARRVPPPVPATSLRSPLAQRALHTACAALRALAAWHAVVKPARCRRLQMPQRRGCCLAVCLLAESLPCLRPCAALLLLLCCCCCCLLLLLLLLLLLAAVESPLGNTRQQQ